MNTNDLSLCAALEELDLLRAEVASLKDEDAFSQTVIAEQGRKIDDLTQQLAAAKEQNALLTVQVQRHQWQPIETAPRDGTPVDLWHKSGGRIPETWWDEEDQCWSCVMDDDCFSHWMPMPPPPIQSAPQPDREANG